MKEKWHETYWGIPLVAFSMVILIIVVFATFMYGFIWAFDWYLNLPWPS